MKTGKKPPFMALVLGMAVLQTAMSAMRVGAAEMASFEDAARQSAKIKFDRGAEGQAKSVPGRHVGVPMDGMMYWQRGIIDATAATIQVANDAWAIENARDHDLAPEITASHSLKAREADRAAFFGLDGQSPEYRSALRELSSQWVDEAAKSLAALDRIKARVPKRSVVAAEYRQYRKSVAWTAKLIEAVYGAEFVRSLRAVESK